MKWDQHQSPAIGGDGGRGAATLWLHGEYLFDQVTDLSEDKPTVLNDVMDVVSKWYFDFYLKLGFFFNS